MRFFWERLLLLAVCLLVWEAAVYLFSPSPLLVAPPSKVLIRVAEMIGGETLVPEFYTHVGITFQELLGAFILSVLIGLPLGVLLALSRQIEALVQPFLLVFFAVPKIVFFPICFLIFGTEMMPKVIFGFILGVFPLILNTQAGIRQIDPRFVWLARSVGYGPAATFFKVVLPAAAPTLIAGLRLALSYCLIGVLVAELLVVSRGVGYLIDWAAFQYFTAELYALVLLTIILGWIASVGLNRLEWLWRT